MSNLNISKTKDDLDVATPAPPKIWQVQPRPAPRLTWDAALVRYGAIGVGAAAAWFVAPEWAHTYVVSASLALGTLAAAKHVLTDWIAGVPVRTWYNRATAEQVVSYLGTAVVEDARRELPSSISSFNPSITAPAAPKALPSATVDAESVTVLPNVAALPPSVWLDWFDTRPHGLLAAETGGGKSTTAKAIIASRIERGEYVFLLDPHSSNWFGLPSIGGGEDWGAVWIGMQVVIMEYRRRLLERDEHLKKYGREPDVYHFDRLTVLLDEANTACRKLDVAKRGAESPWEQFAEALGSGARKVNISILMLAQSPNVEDIGLTGPMRQNFTRLALDAATTRLMVQKEETDPQRKPLLLEALRGLEYPATSVQQGRVVLLDRTGLDRISQPSEPGLSLWHKGYEQVEARLKHRQFEQPARPVVAASVRPSETAQASVTPQAYPIRTDGRTDGAKYTQDKALAYLRWFVRSGKTRDDARAWFDANRLDFQNSLYTKAREMERKQGGS